MRLVKTLVLFVALQSPAPALAQYDGAGLAAGAKAAADELQLYLADVAKAGGRPDLGTAPAAELFARIFDLQHLNVLPPPQGNDLQWLMDWAAAANQANKAIMFFGIKPPVDPVANGAAIERNVMDYQDQQALEFDFLIRLAARESSAMLAFWQQLTPELRTPIREAGLKKARISLAAMISSTLGTISDERFRPANVRRVSAAMRDTGETWAGSLLPDNRTRIMSELQWLQLRIKDDETQENLAAFSAILAAVK